jgi:PST family polysaccharide transporter
MPQSLQSKALAGGVVLIGRQLLGIIFSTAGMLITTRLLGPQKYGQFIIISGLTGYAILVAKMGLDAYLIRYTGQLGKGPIGVAQTLYLVIALLLFAVCIAFGSLAALWYEDASLRDLFWGYAIVPPVTVITAAPMALLDRQLAYRQVARIELSAQLLSLAVSIPIVWFTASVWGLIAGAFVQSVVALFSSWHSSRMEFDPQWDWGEARAQLAFSFGYGASNWIWQLRDLVNPLCVGKLLGSEAVGYVAVAVRLGLMVGFAKNAISRVYLSFLARIANDREAMKEAVETGLNHQVLMLVVSYVVFLSLAPELIRNFIGVKWLPVLTVFPFIAVGHIINAGFSLHSSGLYVIGRTRDVFLLNSLNVALFIPFAWYFMTVSGKISGFGWAEVAAFPSYLVIRQALRRHLFAIREGTLYLNVIAGICAIALMSHELNGDFWPRALLGYSILIILFLAVPQNRNTLLSLALRK